MGALHMDAYGLHMKGGPSGDGVYLEYLKRMAHGCREGAHECITHGCMAQGCQELGVKNDVYVEYLNDVYVEYLNDVYVEYLKWCMKLYRKLSIHLAIVVAQGCGAQWHVN